MKSDPAQLSTNVQVVDVTSAQDAVRSRIAKEKALSGVVATAANRRNEFPQTYVQEIKRSTEHVDHLE